MPMRRVGFRRKKPSKASLDRYEWQLMQMLCGVGCSFTTALSMIWPNQNDTRLPPVKQLFQAGLSLPEIIQAHFDDAIARQLPYYLRFLSLEAALAVAIEWVRLQTDTKQRLRRMLAYPLVLMVFSYLILSVFAFVIFPSVITLLELEQQVPLPLLWIRVLVITVTIAMIMAVCYGAWLRRCYRKDEYGRLWKGLRHWKLTTLTQKYVSYLLAGHLQCLCVRGISTKQALTVLRRHAGSRLIQMLAGQMEQRFTEGEPFMTALSSDWLDGAFVTLCQIGYQSNHMPEVLGEYQTLMLNWLEQAIKRLVIVIQVISYGSIGSVVIMVYQMLLIPLQLLNG